MVSGMYFHGRNGVAQCPELALRGEESKARAKERSGEQSRAEQRLNSEHGMYPEMIEKSQW